MKIALIADELTTASLQQETHTKNITPLNYKVVLKFWKPDILFVESAWKGYKNKWKFKIASYETHPKRNNHKLKKVVAYAKTLGISTIFWNKEDGVHFHRFIDSAVLFDHIFTVDENCLEKYRQRVKKTVSVNVLMFAVQESIHHFTGFDFKYHRANFVGSYSHHIHPKRRQWQDMQFIAAACSGLGLDIYDRNSDRKSKDYRYPPLKNQTTHASVPYEKTAQIYKDYVVSLNVNTIENSNTMFSRRLVEILACGGIAITNNSPAVERYFKDYCYVIEDEEELMHLFTSLQNGPTEEALVRAKKGAAYIKRVHTWKHRLEEIKSVLKT